jgi:hypothetical protein
MDPYTLVQEHARGQTSVHVNRILQGFRRDNLISLAHHRLTLLDV